MSWSHGPSATAQARLMGLDALRGIAILMMVAFHFCFDLTYWRLAHFQLLRITSYNVCYTKLLRSPVAGKVIAIKVALGDKVVTGSPLMQFEVAGAAPVAAAPVSYNFV